MKKIISSVIIIAISVIMFVLAGCGNNNTDGTEKATTKVTATIDNSESEDEDGEINLTPITTEEDKREEFDQTMETEEYITVKVSSNYVLRSGISDGKRCFAFALSNEERKKPEDDRNWEVTLSFEDATIKSIEYFDYDGQTVKKEELDAENVKIPTEISGKHIDSVNVTIERGIIRYTAYLFRGGA